MSEIRVSALEVNRSFSQLKVWHYQITLLEEMSERDTITQVTRRCARTAAFFNNYLPVTDLGDFSLIAAAPLHNLDHKDFTLDFIGEGLIHSENTGQREAIQRLLNQDVYQGALHMVRQTALNESSIQQGVTRNSTGLVELTDSAPSSRVKYQSDYLDVFQSVILSPQILADGTALIACHLKHALLAKPEITLDWVLKKRQGWLPHLQRVRHTYADSSGKLISARLLGLAADKNPLSLLAGLNKSLLDYHFEKGNFHPRDRQLIENTSVVQVAYGNNNKPLDHLAALLRPLFDFDTLQRVDDQLLNRVAQGLKWPMMDRIQASHQRFASLHLPHFRASLIKMKSQGVQTRNIRPNFRLRFSNSWGTSEKEVLSKKAFAPMQRHKITCIPVGQQFHPGTLSNHFHQTRNACQKLSPTPLSEWKGLTGQAVISSPEELDQRLAKSPQQNALLLIALNGQSDKASIRNVAYRHGLACQFMRTDHPSKTYNASYYGNLAAGVFSKAGGTLCSVDQMPGNTDLFIGIDMGGVSQRAPGSAFLFTRNGTQLGWQLTDLQPGEKLSDQLLADLIEKSLRDYQKMHSDQNPGGITLHRDGRFFESLEVIKSLEDKHGVTINVLEVIKSGAPVLFRAQDNTATNPLVGDCLEFTGLDEMILSTYSGEELGRSWGNKVSVRPLRLRKRYGVESLEALAQQVLTLSRIHGASLYRHPRLPVTTHHADRFATLRQECNLDDLARMDRNCPVYL